MENIEEIKEIKEKIKEAKKARDATKFSQKKAQGPMKDSYEKKIYELEQQISELTDQLRQLEDPEEAAAAVAQEPIVNALSQASTEKTVEPIITPTNLTRAITYRGANPTGRLLTIATTHGAICPDPTTSQYEYAQIPDNFRCLYGQYVTEAGTTNISDPDAINKLIKLIIPMLQKTNIDTSVADFNTVLHNIMRETIKNSFDLIVPSVMEEVTSYIKKLRANTRAEDINALRDRLRWLTFLAGCVVDMPIFRWSVIKGKHTPYTGGSEVSATIFPEKIFIKEETTGRKTFDWKLVTTILPPITTNMSVNINPEVVISKLNNGGYEAIQPNIKNIFPKISGDQEFITLSQIFKEVNDNICNNYTFIDFTCNTVLSNIDTFEENTNNAEIQMLNKQINTVKHTIDTNFSSDLSTFLNERNPVITEEITKMLAEYNTKISAINNRQATKYRTSNQTITPVRGGYTKRLSIKYKARCKKFQKTKGKKSRKTIRRRNTRTRTRTRR